MLRRPPTAIKLTQEDIAMYEDAKREREKAGQKQLEQQEGTSSNPHDRDVGAAGAKKAGGRSREERIGVSGSGGSGR